MGERARPRISATAVQTREEDEPDWKSSVFHITINSNRKPKTLPARQDMIAKLDDHVNTIFTDYDFLEEMIQFQVRGDDMHKIQSIDTEYTVEQGTKRGRVHAHVTVRIIHNSKIRIDPKSIANSTENLLGYRPYVHIQGSRDNAFNQRQYAAKANLARPAPPKPAAAVPKRRSFLEALRV